MNFTVRLARAADVSAMHALRLSVRENRLSEPGRVTAADTLRYIDAGTAWIAEAAHDIVGFAVVDGHATSVWALFVDPEAEGMGVGRALHATMLEWARDQGIARLSLSTEAGSRACTFYARQGWREAGITTDGELRFELWINQPPRAHDGVP